MTKKSIAKLRAAKVQLGEIGLVEVVALLNAACFGAAVVLEARGDVPIPAGELMALSQSAGRGLDELGPDRWNALVFRIAQLTSGVAEDAGLKGTMVGFGRALNVKPSHEM